MNPPESGFYSLSSSNNAQQHMHGLDSWSLLQKPLSTSFLLPFKLEMNQPAVQRGVVVALLYLPCPVCRKVERISCLVNIHLHATRIR